MSISKGVPREAATRDRLPPVRGAMTLPPMIWGKAGIGAGV